MKPWALSLLLVGTLAHAHVPGADKLTDAKPEVRRQAIEALGATLAEHPTGAENDEILRALERALSDSEYNVRAAALDAMQSAPRAIRTTDAALLQSIIARLDDDSAGVRERAAMLLGALADRRAMVPLVGRLSDASRDVRVAALYALGRIGDVRADAAISRAARLDTALDVRAEAITALERVAGPSALETLSALTTAPEERLRARALEALGVLGARDVAAAAPILIASLERPDAALLAASALRRMGPRATPALIEALASLTSKLSAARPTIVTLLGETHDARAAAPLVALLSRDASLAPWVLDALGELPPSSDAQVLVPLAEALDSKNVALRRHAARAMARSSDTRLEAVRLRHLADVDLDVRRAIIEQAGRHRLVAAIPALIVFAQASSDDTTARIAVTALGELSDPRARAALLMALDHDSATIRHAAADALAHDSDAAVLSALTPRLGQSSPKRVDFIGAILAASAAHPTHAPRAQLVALAQGAPDAEATRALCVLSVIASSETLAPIAKLSRNRSRPSSVRRAAVAALASFAAAAREPLKLARADEEASVRAEATWSLAKLDRKQPATRAWIALRLVDRQDAALADATYALRLGDGSIKQGVSDAAGFVCETMLPAGDAALVSASPANGRTP